MNDPSNPNRFSLTDQVMALVPLYKKTFFAPADKFTIAQLPTPGVTTLRNTKVPLDMSNAEGCLDWTFAVGPTPHRTDGWHGFVYVKPQTRQEQYTVKLTYFDNEEMSWDAVLYDAGFFEDTKFPIVAADFVEGSPGKFGQVRRSRIYTQDVYLDAVTAASEVKVQIYISDKPFSKRWLLRPQPQPTRVNWNFGVSEGDFGRCLHDDIEVPMQRLNYTALYNGDSSITSSSSGALGAQNFYATNFKKRSPFVKISVQQQDGLYIAIKKTYFPPPHSKPSEVAA